MSVSLSVCLSVCLSFSLSLSLSLCLSVCLSVCLSLSPSLSPPLSLISTVLHYRLITEWRHRPAKILSKTAEDDCSTRNLSDSIMKRASNDNVMTGCVPPWCLSTLLIAVGVGRLRYLTIPLVSVSCPRTALHNSHRQEGLKYYLYVFVGIDVSLCVWDDSMCVCVFKPASANTHTRTHARVHTHTHMHTHTHTHTHTHAHIHTHTHTYTSVRTRVHKHTHTYVLAHSCAHTSTHTRLCERKIESGRSWVWIPLAPGFFRGRVKPVT